MRVFLQNGSVGPEGQCQ
jgi:hypothetical protein